MPTNPDVKELTGSAARYINPKQYIWRGIPIQKIINLKMYEKIFPDARIVMRGPCI